MVERITPSTNTVPMNEDAGTQVVRSGSVAQNDVEFTDREAAENNAPSPAQENEGKLNPNMQASDLSRTDVETNDDGSIEKDNRPDPIEAKRKDFDAAQEAQRKNFERDSKATVTKMQRDQDFAEQKAKRDKEIADKRQKNQELAFEHGVLTHDQLVQRNGLMAPHQQSGALLPHEVLADGEETVLMAFPRTVLLTLSADDVKRWRDNEPTGEGLTPVTHGSRVVFYQGYEDVPVGLSDHSYLRDAGAYRVSDDGTPESVEDRQSRLKKAKEDRKKAHDEDKAEA